MYSTLYRQPQMYQSSNDFCIFAGTKGVSTLDADDGETNAPEFALLVHARQISSRVM